MYERERERERERESESERARGRRGRELIYYFRFLSLHVMISQLFFII